MTNRIPAFTLYTDEYQSITLTIDWSEWKEYWIGEDQIRQIFVTLMQPHLGSKFTQRTVDNMREQIRLWFMARVQDGTLWWDPWDKKWDHLHYRKAANQLEVKERQNERTNNSC